MVGRHNMKWLWRSLVVVGVVGSAFFIFAILLPSFLGSTYSSNGNIEELEVSAEEAFVVTHIETPEPLKALYMTSCVTATQSWRQSLKELIESTELNAVVIDIKDYTGTVSFPNNFPKSSPQKGCVVSDMKEFIGELHAKNIYVIGRISVFQDVSYSNLFPELAVKNKAGEVWRDNKGLSFIDVGAKPYWDYVVQISERAYELGFDELNYYYLPYPSYSKI